MADRPATQGRPALRPEACRPERWTVERFASVDSTNRWLLDAARGGAPAGLVAVADHQDAGRGRRGRSWEAAPGDALLVSVLLRPRIPLDRVHVLTIATVLALADAVEQLTGLAPTLKWPNDLLVGERKLAGLLAEADVVGDEMQALVIGAGCNLAQRAFPEDLVMLATSCAMETDVAPDRDEMLDAFLAALDARLDAPDAVLPDYRRRLATLGREVRVELEHDVLEGMATDVDDDGRLVVTSSDGTRRVIAAGDVVHLRAT